MLNNEHQNREIHVHMEKVFLSSFTSVLLSRVVIKVQKENDDDLKERRIFLLLKKKNFQEMKSKNDGRKKEDDYT